MTINQFIVGEGAEIKNFLEFDKVYETQNYRLEDTIDQLKIF